MTVHVIFTYCQCVHQGDRWVNTSLICTQSVDRTMLCSITCTLPNTHTHRQTHKHTELWTWGHVKIFGAAYFICQLFAVLRVSGLAAEKNQVFPLNCIEFRRHSNLFVYRLFTGERGEGCALVLLDGLEPCELHVCGKHKSKNKQTKTYFVSCSISGSHR